MTTTGGQPWWAGVASSDGDRHEKCSTGCLNSAAAATVTASDFLATLFPDRPPGLYPMACAVPGDPKTAPGPAWTGTPVNGSAPALPEGTGWYFSPALFARDDSGRIARDKGHARTVHAIVLDDIGSNGKTTPERIALAPSWEIETSPDNSQYGFLLGEPVSVDDASSLLRAIAAAGLADTNGSNPVRWARLPGGLNCKAAVVELWGEPFPVALVGWAPDRRYSLAEIADGLGLHVVAPTPQASTQAAPGPSLSEWEPAARKLAWDGARRTHDNPLLGRHAEVFRLGAYAARDGLPRDALPLLLAEFARLMRPSDTSGNIAPMHFEAERKTIADGYAQGLADLPAPVDPSEMLRRAAERASSEPRPGPDATGEGKAKLTQDEAETLVAWAWRAGAPLPDPKATGTFDGLPDKNGKPIERLRVPIAEYPTYTAPWLKIAWEAGDRARYIDEIGRYLPRREAQVEREAERTGKMPQDIPADVLRADAVAWLDRILALDVPDETGRALLARVGGTAPVTPPAPEKLIATEEELAAATLSPRRIVRNHTYADVAQVVAPGGTGKTTVLIWESVHIAIGRPLWGLAVESPGWSLYVTAEDQRPRLLARLREILREMDLTASERDAAIAGFRVWDVSGEQVKLIQLADGNIVLTNLADAIVTAYQADPPAVVIFDPLVSFGASEQAVNDNEQGIITAARRIVKGLDCCVRLVHHTGKANARDGTLDQYSGRGGSALADGSRMTTILQAWQGDGAIGLTPPPGCTLDPGTSIVVMARAKLSYAPPQPLIWLRRRGFEFEHYAEPPKLSPAAFRSAQADQVERYLVSQLAAGRYHTARSLEEASADIGIPQKGIRRALSELRVSGRVVDADMPKDHRHGSRKTYLAAVAYCGTPDAAVPADTSLGPDLTAAPSTTAAPYRDCRTAAVAAAVGNTPLPALRPPPLPQYTAVAAVAHDDAPSDLPAAMPEPEHGPVEAEL